MFLFAINAINAFTYSFFKAFPNELNISSLKVLNFAVF